MAVFNVDFTVAEASDNSSVTITDSTPDYGAGDIQRVFDSGAASLYIKILDVQYDAIDVTSYFDGDSQANLVFTINPEDLKISTVAQFAATEDIPDGDWNIVYDVDDSITNDIVTEDHLIYGAIEKEVLNELRVVDINAFGFEESLRKALIRLAHYAYMQGMVNASYVGQISNLRTILALLQTMVANGTY
jgi:hypothetical protein